MLAGVALDITESVKQVRELERLGTALEEANEKLRSLSLTDELTNLPNRRAFDGRLLEFVSSAKRAGQSLSLLLDDLDDFKKVNDSLGHLMGDSVLRELGKILSASKRTHDFAARYGGEEFVVLLPHTDDKGARVVAERLLDIIRRHEWEVGDVTASVGCACLLQDMDESLLLEAADKALYAAKASGKNRVFLSAVDI